jgi:hypothetical protein
VKAPPLNYQPQYQHPYFTKPSNEEQTHLRNLNPPAPNQSLNHSHPIFEILRICSPIPMYVHEIHLTMLTTVVEERVEPLGSIRGIRDGRGTEPGLVSEGLDPFAV